MPGAVVSGFVGCGFMGRADAHALRTINHLARLPKRIRLVSISSRRPERAARFAHSFEDGHRGALVCDAILSRRSRGGASTARLQSPVPIGERSM